MLQVRGVQYAQSMGPKMKLWPWWLQPSSPEPVGRRINAMRRFRMVGNVTENLLSKWRRIRVSMKMKIASAPKPKQFPNLDAQSNGLFASPLLLVLCHFLILRLLESDNGTRPNESQFLDIFDRGYLRPPAMSSILGLIRYPASQNSKKMFQFLDIPNKLFLMLHGPLQ